MMAGGAGVVGTIEPPSTTFFSGTRTCGAWLGAGWAGVGMAGVAAKDLRGGAGGAVGSAGRTEALVGPAALGGRTGGGAGATDALACARGGWRCGGGIEAALLGAWGDGGIDGALRGGALACADGALACADGALVGAGGKEGGLRGETKAALAAALSLAGGRLTMGRGGLGASAMSGVSLQHKVATSISQNQATPSAMRAVAHR